jgi:DNA repair protein SbcC/Rad50
MRIEQVLADSFGPFSEAELAFAPGFTIVHGLNESGKTTWHAALYAAVCGMRRSRGRPAKEDEDFAALHRPWDRQGWRVRAVIRLEDGRRIELHQDLEGRVDCWARDLVLGRDVSNEIMNGTPDASRWLGLDRRSFLATACIQQADLLGILTNPSLLQEHLQRAAATAGETEATAAAAISRIEEFKREHVGADMVHSRKPLRVAKSSVETAERALRDATAAHAQFSGLSAQADRARKRAEESERELALLRAAVEEREAEQLRKRLARASELAARDPDGPPAGPAENEGLAVEVAAALQGWEGRPSPVELSGSTSAELRRELEGLPAMPSGDLEPAPEVVKAHEDYRRAVQAIDLLGAAPLAPAIPATGGLGEQALLEMARDLELEEPPPDPSLEAQAREARAALGSPPTRSRRLAPLIGAAVSLIGGGILAASHLVVAGITAVGVTALLVAWVAVSAGRGNRAQLVATKRVQTAEAALGARQFHVDQVRSCRRLAQERARSAGIPADPAVLRGLSDDLASASKAQEHLAGWRSKDTTLRAELASAAEDLGAALRSRDAQIGDDLERDVKAYLDACRGRAGAARAAQRRPSLESALRTRAQLEDAAGEADRKRAKAATRLHDLAGKIGADAANEEAVAEALTAWQVSHAEELQGAQVALSEWAELETILDGRSLADLESLVQARTERAQNSATGLDPVDVDVAAQIVEGDGGIQLETARKRAADDRTEADTLAGSVETESARLRSVPEVEETLGAARRELERVVRLDQTLADTLTLLRNAQDQAHRDIAPVLAATVQGWLPELTAGRYVEVTVDPASLDVLVQTQDGRRRRARHLSQGTREQVYLLLRVALAEHLAKPGEVIPLVLDDVTVQCDAPRTASLLGILHQVSRERQVILFTQEDDVLRWAEAHLDPLADRLIRLKLETTAS